MIDIEVQEIREYMDKIPKTLNGKIKAIEADISLLRLELEHTRPRVPAFSRSHKFQEFNPKNKKWEWKEEPMVVKLKKFNARPGIEEAALDIGKQIADKKQAILAIIRSYKHTSMLSRKGKLNLLD